MTSRTVIRTAQPADLQRISEILLESGVAQAPEIRTRIQQSLERSPDTCFVGVQNGVVSGVALSVFNGFHLFLHHFAVTSSKRNNGLSAALHQRLVKRAQELQGLGVIADATLTSTGFYDRLGYRLPGAVFLMKDLQTQGGPAAKGATAKAGMRLRPEVAGADLINPDPRSGDTPIRIVPRLRRAYLSISRCGDAAFSSYGMTTDQYALMRIIHRAAGITQAHVGNDLFADPNTISAMVSLLEQRGILRRKTSRLDGRARCLHFTQRGRRLMQRLAHEWEPMRHELLNCFAGEAGQQALRILDRVCEQMTLGRAAFLQSAKPAKGPKSASSSGQNGKERKTGGKRDSKSLRQKAPPLREATLRA